MEKYVSEFMEAVYPGAGNLAVHVAKKEEVVLADATERIRSLETALAAEREKVRKLRGAATFARRGCSFNSMFAECEVLDEALSETAPKEEGHE